MKRRLRISLTILLGSAAVLLAIVGYVTAHTVGAVCSSAVENCEKWSATVQGPPPPAGQRPDEFPEAVAISGTTVFVGVRAVEFNVSDPYSSRASWTVAAYDLTTGAELWRVFRQSRTYDSLHNLAVSPDGHTVVATGGAYDAFPVGATDSRITTVGYDAATGAELWSATWDGNPAGVDNGNVVAFSPDSSSVYIGGVTTAATGNGDLNYVTIAYEAGSGTQKWVEVYNGLGAGGTNAPFDLAVSPDGNQVYVTGESAGAAQYELDYATVAYDASSGSQLWASRSKPTFVDRAACLAVDKDHVYVTGDSYTGPNGGDYQALTVALNATDGSIAWQQRLGGSGYNGGRAIAVGGGAVVVTTQSPSTGPDEGLTALTAAYDAATGQQLWVTPLAEPLRSQLANGLAVAPDGSRVYLIASSRPHIQNTALDDQEVIAYNLADGSTAWSVHLDSGADNALTGNKVVVAPDGQTLATLGQITRSAVPLGPPDQNIYDSLVVALPARASPTPSPSPSPSPTPTPSPSPSPDPSPTPSPSPSPSPTSSPSPDASPSPSPTATATPTASPTPTSSPTPTATPTPSVTATPTASPSPVPTAAPGQLLNISTRLDVRTGDQVMIGGFIITGNAPKNVLLRGLGPSLNVNGTAIPGRLGDPTLELRDQNGALILFNDNWKDTQQSQIEATRLAPSDDHESAIVRQLDPGRYTAVLRGKTNTTGIGLVEVYDLDRASNPQLANISTRGFVETGDNVMIGGCIAGPNDGGGPAIVVRALGPSLRASQVPQTLDDPTLELRDANGALFAANDDWPTDEQARKVTAAGLAPTDPRESALYREFSPAAFTAIVRGKNGIIGNALLEIYNLNH